MTRLEALKELLEQVEAGEWDFRAISPARVVFPYRSSSAEDLGLTARAAFDGFLDAAKALHEAVLPGWDWCVIPTGVSVYSPVDNSPIDADLDDPARAWLIAILKALIAQEQTP